MDSQGIDPIDDGATVASDDSESSLTPVASRYLRRDDNTVSMLNGAAEVFGISPDAALELLCQNVSNLANSGENTPTSLGSSTPTQNSPARKGGGSYGGSSTTSQVTELHFTHTADDESRGKRDSVQQSILSKRFSSKREPPIPLRDYLLRLHRYCPMSTAVYLATSIYITRIVSEEKVIAAHPRNIHRLVLAGLRAAMKALEDLSYPHSRFAKVGGVSERELSRLEISFCFLTDFELRVDAHMLMDEVSSLQARMESSLGGSELASLGLESPAKESNGSS